ncbi:MAG: nucleotidyltransferase domain-containing protein [Candidatus Melainabacteria bacterium]|jgi:predicted nucleotidyltransferase|nr:nucleotidyltransferase domain-containing protein [Candidatus Melainabacteria bacterium]
MLKTTQQVIEQLQSMQPSLKQIYGIEHLWLFGSVARNEATAFSDLDLLYQPSLPLGLELMSLWDELEATFGCKVDLGDVRYVKPRLKASISKDLIDVF